MKKHLNIVFCLIFILFGCNFSFNQKSTNNYLNIIPRQKIEYKDSLYIMFTINAWMENNFDLYHDYSKDGIGIKKEDIQMKIAKTFYSPDSLKIFCWIITKEPNNPDCKRPQGYAYSSSDVIGFRDSLKAPWKLYPLELETAVCYDSINGFLDILSQYYCGQMKEQSEFVVKKFLNKNYGGEVRYDLEKQTIDLGYGNANSPVILKNYGYNLQDKDFWDKNLLWQKGARIPGLYNFQTKGNVTPDETDVQLFPPKIIYPDSILKMYK